MNSKLWTLFLMLGAGTTAQATCFNQTLATCTHKAALGAQVFKVVEVNCAAPRGPVSTRIDLIKTSLRPGSEQVAFTLTGTEGVVVSEDQTKLQIQIERGRSGKGNIDLRIDKKNKISTKKFELKGIQVETEKGPQFWSTIPGYKCSR